MRLLISFYIFYNHFLFHLNTQRQSRHVSTNASFLFFLPTPSFLAGFPLFSRFSQTSDRISIYSFRYAYSRLPNRNFGIGWLSLRKHFRRMQYPRNSIIGSKISNTDRKFWDKSQYDQEWERIGKVSLITKSFLHDPSHFCPGTICLRM